MDIPWESWAQKQTNNFYTGSRSTSLGRVTIMLEGKAENMFVVIQRTVWIYWLGLILELVCLGRRLFCSWQQAEVEMYQVCISAFVKVWSDPEAAGMSLGTSCWQVPLMNCPLIQPLNPLNIPASSNSSIWAIRTLWYWTGKPGGGVRRKAIKGRGRQALPSYTKDLWDYGLSVLDLWHLFLSTDFNGCPGPWDKLSP